MERWRDIETELTIKTTSKAGSPTSKVAKLGSKAGNFLRGVKRQRERKRE
jgi:hypothetical protein